MAKRPKKQDLLQLLLEAAKNHGEESEQDMEVGDLQEIVAICWSCLTQAQQKTVALTALKDFGHAQWMTPEKVTINDIEIAKDD